MINEIKLFFKYNILLSYNTKSSLYFTLILRIFRNFNAAVS